MFSPRIKSRIPPDLLSRIAISHKPDQTRHRDLLYVPELSDVSPGLPRGAITEICGKRSSGKTTLMLSIAAESTSRGKSVALVDVCNSLDPLSAQSAGIELNRLLWTRCGGKLEIALKVTDIFLHGGAFEIIILDAGDLPERALDKIPMMYWFRFRRAIANTPALFLILAPRPVAGSCSSIVLAVESEGVAWKGNPGFRLVDSIISRTQVFKSKGLMKAGTISPKDRSARSNF